MNMWQAIFKHSQKRLKATVARFTSLPVWLERVFICLAIILIATSWSRIGFQSVQFDTDLGRDLKEISEIWAGNVVWLGPRLDPGYHATSLYYYLFFPAVWLAGGHPFGMVIMNIALGCSAIFWFGWLAYRRYGVASLLATVSLALSPWMLQSLYHPSNGFTHVFFVLLAVTSFWFGLPIIVTSLFAGFATAFHPTAIFLPILVFFAWLQKPTWQRFVVAGIGMVVGWLPTLGFEFLTKGYLVRQWLAKPSSGTISQGWGVANWYVTRRLVGLNNASILIPIMAALGSIWQAKQKKLLFKQEWLRWLGLFITLLLLALSLLTVTELPSRYLLAAAVLASFSLIISLLQAKWGRYFLAIMACILVARSPLFVPVASANRPIAGVMNTVETIDAQLQAFQPGKVGVVAALSSKTEVPQADDYRALLRFRKYDVLPVTQHQDADTLVMVIEAPHFEWETWSNWEIEQFGPKRVVGIKTTPTATIVLFSKLD